MKIFFLKNAKAEHNHKYSLESFLKRQKNVLKSKKILFEIQPEIKKFFSESFFKKVLFKIFSSKVFLFLFKSLNKNLYFYFL
jgi:hypothetical protein